MHGSHDLPLIREQYHIRRTGKPKNVIRYRRCSHKETQSFVVLVDDLHQTLRISGCIEPDLCCPVLPRHVGQFSGNVAVELFLLPRSVSDVNEEDHCAAQAQPHQLQQSPDLCLYGPDRLQ